MGICHLKYFGNFGTQSLSRERFELQTSNLALILITEGANDINKKIILKLVGNGSRDLLLEFWDRFLISRKV